MQAAATRAALKSRKRTHLLTLTTSEASGPLWSERYYKGYANIDEMVDMVHEPNNPYDQW